MVEHTCEFLHLMKAKGLPVAKLRLDPGGENLALEKRAKSADWKPLQLLEFEFTSQDTPQHNNLAELAFPYLAGQAQAMMGAAHIPNEAHGKVAIKALKYTTQLDGLKVVIIEAHTATRDVNMFDENPRWSRNLHTWGEAGIVKIRKDGKMDDLREQMMFVVYPPNRESDSLRMWNPSTNRVVVTRDIIWLKRMFYEPENMIVMELDPVSMADNAMDEHSITNDASNNDNYTNDDDSTSNQ